MIGPTTTAGRSLADFEAPAHIHPANPCSRCDTEQAIAAIEAEARADVRVQLDNAIAEAVTRGRPTVALWRDTALALRAALGDEPSP